MIDFCGLGATLFNAGLPPRPASWPRQTNVNLVEIRMLATPKLTALSADISGHLFENPKMGVPRGVYWSCSVAFAPIPEGTDEWQCTLLCDWISWPVRSWRDIDGLTLANCTGPLQMEASLYFLGEHQMISTIELSFHKTDMNYFRATGRLSADLTDLDGRFFRGVEAKLEVNAEFVGLRVVPDNLFPKPKSEAQASQALANFVDLQSYEPPQWVPYEPLRSDHGAWLFRPSLVRALNQ